MYTDTDGGARVSIHERLEMREDRADHAGDNWSRDCKEMKRETLWLLTGSVSQVEEIIN